MAPLATLGDPVHGHLPAAAQLLDSPHELSARHRFSIGQTARASIAGSAFCFTPPPPDIQRGMRTRLTAGIDSAIEARNLSGQSHVSAKTRPRPERGTSPDSLDDAQSKAGSPRNRWSSAPSPWGPARSCGPLRSRSRHRSLPSTRCTGASESKTGNPCIAPDPAAAGTALYGPARSVSEASPAARAHSAVRLRQ
jgi:hypothetical protein